MPARPSVAKKGVLENLSGLMPGMKKAIEKTYITVIYTCVGGDATVKLRKTENRFDPPPVRCPQCRGSIITDNAILVKVGCFREVID